MNTKNVDILIKSLKERKASIEKLLTENGVEFGEDDNVSVLFSTDCTELKKLKVAAIMDTFTLGNFKDECDLMELVAGTWKSQIDDFKPDLLFVESAWNGKGNSWYKKIANGSKELYELTNYCRGKGIPIVFWNKEDPVYTDVFMSAASCADYVFTTDFDCIERYKRTLQHNNVYHLHFSAQPRVHNPIEMHNRKDKFCFAGAYYHRYKDRSMVFDAFADVFERGKGLEIYDRNLGNARPEHAFPSRYNKMIVGTLKPEDIHIAYKGYNYGINMNSVGQSQTMFARRVFELLASNTVVIGNYSRGTKNLFGDLTVCTDNADTMEKQLMKYCGTPENYRKYRLAGLRSVLENHLCEDRLGFVAQCVFGKDIRSPKPEIVVVSAAADENEKAKVKEAFDRQEYQNKTLVFLPCEDYNIPENAYVAAFDCADYYGKNYLKDLALSVRYSDADGFGKVNFYENTKSGILLNGTDATYRPCSTLFSARCIVKAELINDIAKFAEGEYISGSFFCTDEFNYCRNYSGDKCGQADDLFIADCGISLETINSAAKSMNYTSLDSDILKFTPNEIMDMCGDIPNRIEAKLENGKFVITSNLPDDKFVYIYFKRKFFVDEFPITDKLSMLFRGTGGLSTENFCMLYDADMKNLGTFHSVGSRILTAEVPSGARYIKLALRVRGSGKYEYSGIMAGDDVSAGGGTPFLSRSDTLVLADHYPTYENLYRYMFIHKRILLYKENGLVPDMMCMNMWYDSGYREFEGVNVVDGYADKLSEILETGRVKTVCAHFLNPYMWSVLKNYLDEIKLIVWCHGSEIQPWHRREFNYKTNSELEEAKKESAKRQEFWKEIFSASEKYNIHFVVVSEYFKKEIEEDNGVDLTGRCSVIHNCIDTDLFTYEKKDESQRFNIMSVKAFSSMKYANDITQKAIVRLSLEPEFSKMTFDLYGDGDRFDEDTRLIKNFPNVHLNRRFLTQTEISELHKKHGIFIATTRMDSQGVSRDEAMSSGLVPIANAVTAIPEFVDETCGILAPGEDADAVAEGILKLVRDPELFLEMSENAANHVRGLTSKKYTIDKETALIANTIQN